MTESPRPAGAHRAEAGSRRLALLLASLLGVLLVAGAVWYALKHRGANDTASTTITPPAASSTHTGASSAPPTSASPSSTPAAPPSSTSPPPSSSPAPSASAASSSVVASEQTVDVLNNTHVSGLAARAAQKLRAAGWQVRTVTNYRAATLSTTTVFYPAGRKAAADALAKAFGVSAVAPAPADVAQDALTLVLTSDWAGGK